MFKNTFIYIFCFFLFCIYSVHALSSEQKGAILDNFKEMQYDLLFENSIGNIELEDANIFQISKKVNIFGNIKDKLQKDREDIVSKNENLSTKIITLQDSLDLLNEDIEESTIAVNKLNGKIINIKSEIDTSKITIDLLNKKIGENRKVLLKYLVYVYKKGNNVFSDAEIDNIKTILLNEEDVSGAINDLYFKGLIQVTGKKLIDQHRTYISELYVKKVELEKKESTLKKLRKAGIINRKILSDKKEFKERILKITKGKQALYEKYIADKLKIERSVKLKSFKEKIKFNNAKEKLLQKYNCIFVDLGVEPDGLTGLSDQCRDINKIIYAESQLKGFGIIGNNIFSWPIQPSLGISSYFHDTEYRSTFGSDHDAIDVPTPQGTAIVAPADGYVTFLQVPETVGYASIALKHSDGFLTVYGHVSEILVGEYDYVKKGQIFAKTGGEFGTKGAGLMTTGPHLHFEIFKDEESVDPFNHLNLSYIKFAHLPLKYKYKFYNDYKERRGFDYNDKTANERVFKLDGSTEIERQQSLIDKYAVGAFRNWSMWVEESLDGNIDPSFTMCIGLAETGLGKHLKTPYNVGNIGNTDSGAVKQFANARSGTYWMIKTLNNKYLGNYTKIKELSRYGNKDGTIYASSPDNWHNNIIKCMSSIKGVYVPDDFNFRITKS